jgi:ATP-dependent helicase/nuclease subunit A
MRDRLAGWLAEWAMQASVEARIRELRMRGIGADDAVRLEPALRALHGRMLESGRPVAVLTFHAWFVQLLRLAPLEMLESLGLQPDMSLIEDDVDLRAPVFRAFHAAVLRDPALRADYGAMVATRGRHMLDLWLGRAWQRRMEIAQADAAGTLEGSVEPASEWWAELEGIDDPAQQVDDAAWRERLLALAAAWQRHKNKTPRDAAAEITAAYALPTSRARFEAIDSALLTQAGTVRKNCPSRRPWPRPASSCRGCTSRSPSTTPTSSTSAWSGSRERCLPRMPTTSDAMASPTWPISNGWRWPRCAMASSPAGCRRSSTCAVRHLLIDEFRYTSPLQWHALHACCRRMWGPGGAARSSSRRACSSSATRSKACTRRGAEPRVFEAAAAFVSMRSAAIASPDHTGAARRA